MTSLVQNAYIKGQQKLFDQFDAEEKTKSGKLRGGNTGMLTEDGEYIGTCAAKTWLRFKGINTEGPSWSRELMFGGGRANEQIWMDVLNEGWPGILLAEEQVPTRWETSDGVLVTGRPDIVLCDIADEGIKEMIKRFPERKAEWIKAASPDTIIPEVGIELKQVSSLWTARTVMFDGAPKLNHVMQAAHYSWQLGIPFELWYTNRTDMAVTGDWAKKLFPEYGQPGSEHCQYSFNTLGPDLNRWGNPVKRKISEGTFLGNIHTGKYEMSTDILKVLPFMKGYQLKITDDQVWYKSVETEYDAGWTKSIVNIQDIKRFYNSIPKLKTVPKMPIALKINNKKENYKLSDYCELGELCCGKQCGRDINEWSNKVKTVDLSE